jgi:aminodeoxyfutalosine synthase
MQNIITSRTKQEQQIAETVLSGGRISNEQALYLYQNSDPVFCGWLAYKVRERQFGKQAFFNKNIHVEITNICLNKCKFCSFYRQKGQEGAWDLEKEDVLVILTEKVPEGITEVHFTGGLHPEKSTAFYADLFAEVKSKYPQLHIKAFTAVEIEYFAKADNLSLTEVLKTLKTSGLNSLAGGGAEILDDKIRKKLCPEKTDSQTWLITHRIAHELGMKTNCTMLYGHIESFADRILHMQKLRDLQDETSGFNCFIPLKYKIFGNRLGITTEISLQEELKNYAISRLYLDNIPHLKAYWPMCGKETAILALSFGADDFDGTIGNSTKIYSMAGSEQKPEMAENEIIELLEEAGFVAVERDSEYRELKKI